MTLEITDENFDEIVLTSAKPVVLDFGTHWCSPCKSVGALIDTMAEEYSGQVVMGKINVDMNPKVAMKYRVRNMPTVLYFKGGEVVNKQVGAASKVVLEEKLKTIL